MQSVPVFCHATSAVLRRDRRWKNVTEPLRHDMFSSNAGHVRVSRERNAAVGGFAACFHGISTALLGFIVTL